MRCGKCRRRKTFSKDRSVDRPPCECGGTFGVDQYRQSGAEMKRFGCNCGAFHWSIDNAPHRRGSFSPAVGGFCEYARLSPH